MGQPSTAIARPDLSATFFEFDLMANQMGYIGTQAVRPISVSRQSGELAKVPVEQLLTIPDTARAPKSGYKRGDFDWEPFNYTTAEHGWEELLDDRTLAIYRSLIDAETVHRDRAMAIVAQAYELAAATLLYNTAVWTGASLTAAVTAAWSNWTNAKPITDVLAAKEKIASNSGLEPNALICNRAQYDNLINTDQVKERILYTERATQQNLRTAVAEVLGVSKVLVAGGFKNTANAGQAAAISRIWSNSYVMLARVAETDDPAEPCVARGFMWDGDGPGAAGADEKIGVIVEEYREENVRGGVIRARTDFAQVQLYKEAAFLITGVQA